MTTNPVRRWQPLQRLTKPAIHPSIDQPLIDRARRIRNLHVNRSVTGLDAPFDRHEVRGFADAPPPFHQAGVSDGAVQPCPKGLRLADRGHVLKRLEQRVLHDVFRIFGMAAYQQAEAVRDFLRSHEERFHRATIARGRCLDESCVFGLDVGVRHVSIVRSSAGPQRDEDVSQLGSDAFNRGHVMLHQT